MKPGDELIQKFLKGQTNREEERQLINMLLKDINDMVLKKMEAKDDI